VFERFTERARQVVVIAQDESRTLGHGYIGTEHLLLGLLRERQGIGARVLAELDVTLEDVRARVIAIVGKGEKVGTGQIPFTPEAKHSLSLSFQEALALGHDHIGTEHLLLALVRVDEGVGARILVDLNVDAEGIRQAVIRTLSGPGAVEALPPELDDTRMTSPPLAPELLQELGRLSAERQALLDAGKFEEAARISRREMWLRAPAAALVRAWRQHHGEAPRVD
jgi:ATP-dependent Clp protease ATP-binding subunit ClpA